MILLEGRVGSRFNTASFRVEMEEAEPCAGESKVDDRWETYGVGEHFFFSSRRARETKRHMSPMSQAR